MATTSTATTPTEKQNQTQSQKQNQSPTPAIFANPVSYSELHTPDPARARSFYGELFGWKAAEVETPAGPYTMFDGLLAGLTAPRDGVPPGWVPYIGVPDVAAATTRARELGAQVIRDCVSIPEGTFSVLRDPTGAVLGLWQKR